MPVILLRRAAAAVVVLLLLLVPGCLDDRPGGVAYRVSGALTEDAGDEEARDLERRLRHLDPDVSIMESHPLQYMVTVAGGPACDEARRILESLQYVATVGRCQAVAAP